MKKIVIFLLILSFLFSSCGQKVEKEWTYELLEEEFGGIIETDFDSVKKCIRMIEKHNFTVCGYIIEKSQGSALGVELYFVTLADDEKDTYKMNMIEVCIAKDDFINVEEGDFIYANGEINYSHFTKSVTMSCHTNGYISHEQIEGSISINDYIKSAKEIFEDTYFKTVGLVIQDGTYSTGTPIYKLFESEEAYKENKNSYISIEFSEDQHNLNGKMVVIMGRPDIYISNGLVECSVIEER